MVCSLKQSLSIPMLRTMIPNGLEGEELKKVYSAYVVRHRLSCVYFLKQVRMLAGGILDHEPESELSTADTNDLISTAAVASGLARLLAEKLLLLEGKSLEDGGSVELRRSSKED